MTTITKKTPGFSQVCVWPGTVVGGKKEQADFVKFMKKNFAVRVKYLEEVKTGPDIENGHPVEGTGGRNDLFFAVHDDDVMKFAVPRLQYGIRWIEDVFGNEESRGDTSLYPERIEQYKTW